MMIFIKLEIQDINGWIARAIKCKQISLTDQELIDFLIKSHSKTYSFFEVYLKYNGQSIFLGYFQIFLTDKIFLSSLLNKNNENNNDKFIQKNDLKRMVSSE